MEGSVLFRLNNLGSLAKESTERKHHTVEPYIRPPIPGAGPSSFQMTASPSLVVQYAESRIQGKLINLSDKRIRLLPSNQIKSSIVGDVIHI